MRNLNLKRRDKAARTVRFDSPFNKGKQIEGNTFHSKVGRTPVVVSSKRIRHFDSHFGRRGDALHIANSYPIAVHESF